MKRQTLYVEKNADNGTWEIQHGKVENRQHDYKGGNGTGDNTRCTAIGAFHICALRNKGPLVVYKARFLGMGGGRGATKIECVYKVFVIILLEQFS